ncbi:hypothetical protein [Azohydromonas australica]|uniref:hypothetical protein n=1 Tax=Azohydromonas australica TaxID=364039 RepID=UPI0004087E45|nr:hypothetical protein [Azohydromonas australica]
MALAGNALVAIWNDIAPEMREDFFEWHPREHMVERLGIPGFLRGRRYAAVQADVEFLTLYEVAGPQVLVSDLYRQRLNNPTPWSSRTLPGFRNNVRGACRIHFTAGAAMGGFVYTLRLEAEEGREEALVDALQRQVMPRLCDQPRITAAHFVENDVSLTGGNAGNQRGRMIELPHLVVLIEGSTADGVRTAAARFLAPEALRPLGARPGMSGGLYQLEYSIQNLASGPR